MSALPGLQHTESLVKQGLLRDSVTHTDDECIFCLRASSCSSISNRHHWGRRVCLGLFNVVRVPGGHVALWNEVCPPPSPPNSYVEVLTPSVIIFGDGALRTSSGHPGRESSPWD